MRNTVWVAGAPLVGKTTLVRGLIGQPLDVAHGAHEAPDSMRTRWKLETKYYSADVELLEARPAALTDLSTPGLQDGGCEALILVFDAHEMGTFESVRVLWEELRALDCVSPSIMLCVGNRRGPVSRPTDTAVHATEEEADEENEETLAGLECGGWCNEHGFEYVEADLSLPDAPPHELRGRTGLARIREALACNMWPDMQMKEEGNARKATRPQELLDDCTETQAHTEFQRSSVQATTSASEPAESGTRDVGDLVPDFGLGTGEETDELQEAFEWMRAVRERASTLNDEERRKLAEQAATRFYQMIGPDSDEDVP
eukprot:tig00000944_g5954.t1